MHFSNLSEGLKNEMQRGYSYNYTLSHNVIQVASLQ